jgi:hypothetical protein
VGTATATQKKRSNIIVTSRSVAGITKGGALKNKKSNTYEKMKP